MKTKHLKILIISGIAVLITVTCCISKVDSGEVGIKFKKFSLIEQGTLAAVPFLNIK